jgi:hypothetical protein
MRNGEWRMENGDWLAASLATRFVEVVSFQAARARRERRG